MYVYLCDIYTLYRYTYNFIKNIKGKETEGRELENDDQREKYKEKGEETKREGRGEKTRERRAEENRIESPKDVQRGRVI